MRRAFALGFCLSSVLAATGPAAAAPRLEKVVVLERHGVRAPTQAPAALAPYARNPWAAWPVAPGLLTDHGRAAVMRMGQALRAHYAALLPAENCAAKGNLFVWADNTDQRTRLSGQAMAAALAPGCGVTAAMSGDVENDPLFHAAQVCPLGKENLQASLEGRLGTVLAARHAGYEKARVTLQAILDPALNAADCTGVPSKKCAIIADHNVVRDGKLRGTLADGATLSENLFLEYAEGMARPGWGRLENSEKLAAIMPLHEISSDLARRTPEIATTNGTLLARQIESALTPVPAFPHQAPVPQAAKFVLLLGHDTNLANLAGMLGLDWALPGEPDGTAPDTALAFELWRGGDGGSFVRVKIYYQTPDQLRDLDRFNAGRPLPHVDLALPGCTRKACALPKVIALLESHLVQACLSP